MAKSLVNNFNRIGKVDILMYFLMLMYKFTTELGYWMILTKDTVSYTKDFNLQKYIIGFFWCSILYFGINKTRHQYISTFCLYLTYIMQIIPMTTIYALGNDHSVYYHSICLAFFLCELFVGYVGDSKKVHRNWKISNLIECTMICFTFLLILYIVAKNGVPTLIALNIYDVYELRSSDQFQISKYMNYILSYSTKVFIPFILAKTIIDTKYHLTLMYSGILFLIYLYSGHKTFLFSIPLIIVSCLWAKRKNFYHELFIIAKIGFSVLVLFVCFSPLKSILLNTVYSLFGRRLMMVPANLKFLYYDFFTQNELLGFAGIFPRWLIDVYNPYELTPFPNVIADVYLNSPQTWASTGFLAEGFQRFGHIGTFFVLFLYGIILKIADRFQKQVGYPLALGILIYPVMVLTDTQLLGTLFFGSWGCVMVIVSFYCNGKPIYKVPKLRY